MPPQLNMSNIDASAPLLQHKQHFSISTDQLCDLIDSRQQSSLERLGGTKTICDALEVDPTIGLLPDESFDPCYGVIKSRPDEEGFADRKRVFGRNTIPDAPPKSLLFLVWQAYNDQTLIMLTIAAIVSLVAGFWNDMSDNHPKDEPKIGWVDGVAILAAVAVVIITNAINDYEKEKQFRKLNAKKEDRPVKVLRRGMTQQVHVCDIVVGDIMFIEPGDMITVDCLYLEGHNVHCDESTATGESRTVKKSSFQNGGDCFLLSGTKILQGVAKVVVVAVGVHSFYGRAMTLMRNAEEEQTPLQAKLNTLADQIAKFGCIAAGLMLIVLVLKLVVQSVWSGHWLPPTELTAELVGIVIQAITIIVVAVPEGLPMAVTLALAFATTEMLKDNNLVRHLSACETMGNATAVCSDKTGTLTENKMTLVRASVGQHQFVKPSEIPGWQLQANPMVLGLAVEGISVNSTAVEGISLKGHLQIVGSTTERALLEFIRRLGYDYHQQRASSRLASVYPFNSTAKSMTSIIEINESNVKSPDQSYYRQYTKGATETIIKNCTHYIDAQGEIQILDANTRLEHEIRLNEYAKKALRTLGLAYRDINKETYAGLDPDNAPVTNLVLIGIVGIQDQLRPGVIESVQAFRRAGVFIRMITGDNLETAKAIGKECGILTPGGVAMTGPEFRALSSTEQLKVLPRLQILARSSPIDKTIVVSRLQALDEIVAMTGDGTNDGPALKMANVGFAMGVSGTEVAKEASDIILMDDNFSSILQALKWGRAVNDGVRKFLTFQLTVNIAAVVLSFVSALVSETSESILSAVQLLWVNMIMDTFAALALATEPLTNDLVDRKPLRKDSSLINWRMSRMIVGQAVFQIVINLVLLFHGAEVFGLTDSDADTKILRTMVFNVFVFMQVFNELNCRRIDDNINVFRGIRHDFLFLVMQTLVVVSQVAIITWGGMAFKTVSLTATQWLFTIGIGAISLPVGTLIRLLPSQMPYLWSENKDDEFVHVVSYPRLLWESAITRILQSIKSFSSGPKSSAAAIARAAAEEGEYITDDLKVGEPSYYYGHGVTDAARKKS
ncbi:PMCA-type calcium-translocating P-type ATPase [Phycomyces blakesleeanus]|uniref:Calcium-transporting ATPase n=1 Tax=Phycomyces blakesleeanus TaxID=4837 RepID=A0ABR3AQD9_PHYBL